MQWDICCKRMKVRANRSMKALLGADAEFPERVSVPCPSALLAELEDGFKELDGCVVPKRFENGPIWSAGRVRADNQDDETGLECTVSKIHIEDFVRNDLPLADITRHGIAYALRLREALTRSVPAGVFRIIVDVQLPDADLDLGGIYTIRFHKVRVGQVWLDDDLEHYRQNAVLAMEFAATEP